MDKTNFKIAFDKLNKKQKEAVEEIYWSIMVIAWPWTWKTQILALRTANILLKTDLRAENVFITTFSEAWVIAIRERLISFIWQEAYRVNISTIHSFASEVIKSFPEKFIEFKANKTIDDVEQLEIVKNLLEKEIKNKKIKALTNDYDNMLYLRDIKKSISDLKQEWVSLNKFDNIINEQKNLYEEELSEIKPSLKKYALTKEKQEKHIEKLKELKYIRWLYNSYLRENSLFDFNDMINFVLEKFREDYELRSYYTEKFQFIMIDEFQDTNNAQNEIIKLIIKPTQDEKELKENNFLWNIMVVWDDDQSIYRFQWANIENMLDFSSEFKNTKSIVLEENYRSNQEILDLSKDLIEKNKTRLSNKINIDKNLISSWKLKNDDTKAKLFIAKNDLEEKAFVVKEIKNLLETEKIDIREIAIIVRNNREVEEWSKTLRQNFIEVESKQKSNILNSDFINLVIKYLKIIENPLENEIDLIDLMRSDLLELNQVDIFKLNKFLYSKNYKRKHKIKIIDVLLSIEWDSITWLEDLIIKEKIDIEKLVDFRDSIFKLSNDYKSINLISFFNNFLIKTSFIKYVEKKWDFWDIEDLYTLFNIIKDRNEKDKSLNIEKLISKIELYKSYSYPINRQILGTNKSWVQVLTAHSSKWLEYESVFITWLYNWNRDNKRQVSKLKLPDWIAWEWLQTKTDNLEEDRRLFFVALTRAKKHLYLSYPSSKWTKILLKSMFIEEIENSLEKIDLEIKEQEIKQNIENELVWDKNIIYTEDEINYIEEFLKNYKLSPSDLNVFLNDPKEFLSRVVLRYPFIWNEFTIFWIVYHRTLELFYLKLQKSWKIPDLWYLKSSFKLLLEKELLTLEEFERLIEKWEKSLEGYYNLYASNLEEAIALEYDLRWKNIIRQDIPLTWKIDKIELSKTKDNSDNIEINWQQALFKENVSIIDYKTWKTKSIWEIKWLDRFWNKKEKSWEHFRQLMFYKLLLENDRDFISKYSIWELVIDFVEWKDWKYKKIEVDFEEDEYEEFKKELKESWQKIKDIEFWRKLLLTK